MIEKLAPTSDYTRIAGIYDATRAMPAEVLTRCYERLRQSGLLPAGTVLDAGCGTGQVSLPLGAMGYAIRGYDFSAAMVRVAADKAAALGLPVLYAAADVRRLPERDAVFDAAVAAKLFQHVGDWQRGVAEIVRVLKPGACLVLVDEKGKFRNPVREHLARLADEAGYTQRLPGLRSRADLAACLAEHGCAPVAVDLPELGWESRQGMSHSLEQMRAGINSEFWSIPKDVYTRMLDDTARWLEGRPGGKEAAGTASATLAVEVYRKAV